MKQPGPGIVVAGKYRIERLLSAGGMGSLWIAHHLDLDVDVAIKFLHPALAADEDLRRRFAQEAKIAAHIRSRHVVNVMDHGTDDDLSYMVMELLSGEDLRARLDRCQRLPLAEALRYLGQTVEALEDAHNIGIVHRDIKPENIFLETNRSGEMVKVLDFGIAKWSQEVRTTTGMPIGTLAYMSPEQIRGEKDLDARSDLWSLAVVLFEMITGRPVFEMSESIDTDIRTILKAPVPRITELVPELPAPLEGFFERALSRDRSERFQRASDLLDAFTEIVWEHSAFSLPGEPQAPIALRKAEILNDTMPLSLSRKRGSG